MIDLSRHAAVVTGGTGNLGHAVVRRLLESGAHVAVAVRDQAQGDALRDELAAVVVSPGGTRAGDEADPHLLYVPADIKDAAAMEALVERVLRKWGRIDVSCNLAGGFDSGPGTDLAKIDALWERNVHTVVTPAAACLRPMRARGRGRVVSVSAASALKGGRGIAAYSMSKSAIVRWTESLAAEVKGEGITVNCVLPGTMDHPANRANMPKADFSTWATPDEVAAAILFFCSDAASGVTGQALAVTGRV